MPARPFQELVYERHGFYTFRKVTPAGPYRVEAHWHRGNLELIIPHQLRGFIVTPSEKLPFINHVGLVIPPLTRHAQRCIPRGPGACYELFMCDTSALMSALARLNPAFEASGPQVAWLREGHRVIRVQPRQLEPELSVLRAGESRPGAARPGALECMLAACALVGKFLGVLRQGSDAGMLPRHPRGRLSAELLNFLEKHFEEELTLPQLADRAGVTPHHLCRVFHRETGQAPMQHLSFIRTQKAVELIHGGMTNMTEVGLRVGFHDVNVFIQVFKKQLGITPKRYSLGLTRKAPAARGLPRHSRSATARPSLGAE